MVLDRLVVGLDGSESSASALRWALRYGGSELTVVNARRGHDEDEAEAREWLLAGEWTTAIREGGREADRRVIEGEPASALLDCAEDVRAHAVVVGAHGSGARPGHHLGSVTRHLLHDSEVPLVVVSPDGGAVVEMDHVIASIGYGETAEAAARWAGDFAAGNELPLTLLHVITNRPLFPLDSPVDMVGSYLGRDIATDWAQSELETVRDGIVGHHPELPVDVLVEHGSAVDSIIDSSDRSDLVVVGKRHAGAVSRHIIGPRLARLVARGVATTVVVPSSFEPPEFS